MPDIPAQKATIKADTATQNASSGYTPPRLRVVVALCAVAVALTLGFTALLLAGLRSPKALDPADYEPAAPASFKYTCQAEIREGNRLVLEGYAVDTTDYLVEVNNFVTLYNRQTGTYLRLPTTKVVSTEAEEKYGSISRYSQSGYLAFIYLSRLESGWSNYELCFAYRSNKANWLIHTGQTLDQLEAPPA